MSGTSAFRLASAYTAAMVIAGGLVLSTLYWTTNGLLARQAAVALAAEADSLALVARTGDRKLIIEMISDRTGKGGGLYLLVDEAGRPLAGNLDHWPAELEATGHGTRFRYTRPGVAGDGLAAGIAWRLPNGLGLVVARSLDDQRRLAEQVGWLFLGGFGLLAVLGIAAGLLASHLALRRIEEITRASDAIMAGDLSGRVPVTRANDELDHLAMRLNAMLERIGELMTGLREVSDNIAHDLKTPLARLRSRAEAALGDRADPAMHRAALEGVIEDADELIRTFNALLLIARVEAGAIEDAAQTFDLAALVRDVAELYQPVAEDAGSALTCRSDGAILVHANRQLISQAVANLIDNAIKYGGGAGGSIDVSAYRDGAEAAVAVADRGPGIPAGERERVLKRFVRLEASRSRPGTGLGLSLVAAVARLSGGRVVLADNGPGLRVVLRLPSRASDTNT